MIDAARFELLAFWPSSATYSLRVARAPRGLQAGEQIIDLDAGEQISKAFPRIDPLGAIPAPTRHGGLAT